MDDELKRKIAASLDQPGDTAADPAIAKILSESTQAQSFASGLRVMEKALRNWPMPSRTREDWDTMASAIEARLGETLSDLPWDALERPPLQDEEHRTETPMAESSDPNHDDDDLEALAALTRTSVGPNRLSVPTPPPMKTGPSIIDDGMPESSGIVDIKQLAEIAKRQESAAPVPTAPRADEKPKSETRESKDSAKDTDKDKARDESKSASAEVKAPKAAAVVSIKAGPRRSPIVWAGPLLAAAAVLVFALWKGSTHEAIRAAGTQESGSLAEQPVASATPTPVSPQGIPTGNTAIAPTGAAPPTSPTTVEAVPTVPALRAETPQAPMPSAGAPPAAEPVARVAPVEAPPPPPQPMLAPTTAATEVAANPQPAPSHGAAVAHREQARDEAAPRGAAAAPPPADREPERRSAPAEQPAAPAPSPTATTTTRAASPPAAVAATAPAPAPHQGAGGAAASSGNGARSIDDLMAQAVGGPGGGGHSAGRSAAASGSDSTAAVAPAALPERPTRAQVTSTLAPLSPAVRACTQGQIGTATVAMIISHDGTVQSASVSGPFSSDANSCIAGVARRAHFPAFSRPSVPIVYPFSIQPPRPGG